MPKLSDLRIEDGRLQVTRLKGSNSFEYPLTHVEKKALRARLRIGGDRPGRCSRRAITPASRGALCTRRFLRRGAA